jgi:cell division protein FtsI/penicillin-binding protein 2
LQTASTPSSSSSSLERNKQLLDRFFQSIKSKVTQVNAIDYIHAYIRHWHLYEEEQDLLNDDGRSNKKKQKKQKNNSSKPRIAIGRMNLTRLE